MQFIKTLAFGRTVLVGSIRVGAEVKQHGSDQHMTLVAGRLQAGSTILGASLHVSPTHDEDCGHMRVSGVARRQQGRPSHVVVVVSVARHSVDLKID